MATDRPMDPALAEIFEQCIDRGYVPGLDFYVEGIEANFSSELVIIERSPEGYRVVYRDMGHDDVLITGASVEDVRPKFFDTLSRLAWGRGRGPEPEPREMRGGASGRDPRATNDDAIWEQFS